MHLIKIIGLACGVIGVLTIGTVQIALLRGRLEYSHKAVTIEIVAALAATVGFMLAMAY